MDQNERINENKDTIEEMINNYQNNDNWNESNNGFININIDESEDKKSSISKEMANIDNNSCKVCNNSNDCQQCVCDDISNQFFASGPFYAIENVHNNHINTDNTNHSLDTRQRSEKCSVLYAEMPQLPQMALNSDNLGHNKDNIKSTIDENSICCALDSAHSTTSAHLMVDSNYQFLYYNYCRSPLSVCDSQLSDNLFYLSSDESKVSICDKMDDSQRSTLSSPIMLKFYKENIDEINHNSNKQELNRCCSSKERLSNYTTVIKPKAVRPQFNSMASNSNTTRNIMSSTLSFHGSTNVLTDSDESAFRQIPRRRSNSEATHHYQSVSHDSSQTPVRTSNEKSRPLHMSERCRSVDKAYHFDNSLDSRKCHTFSDKLKLKADSNNPNNIFSNRNTLDKSDNYLEISPQRISTQQQSEPIHMTLEEVRNIFSKNQSKRCKNSFFMPKSLEKYKRSTHELEDTLCKSKSKSKIKCAFENLFRSKRKSGSPNPFQNQNTVQSEPAIRTSTNNNDDTYYLPNLCANENSTSPFTHRALPPLPNRIQDFNTESLDKEEDERQKFLDYAASIERVKDCGWYWGPISGEMAEKLLASEPCGSFIVRDSSDEHYIFSLTFKLNGMVRHVRIEHDQGNFSFGSLQKFRSNTIVDFIENAVEHSRSGRFLFFLHRKPVMGPMRVQLLHPVSRFKQIQSLQHMCRFVILKHVRRDLIDELPLPKTLKSYLNTPYYYSEELAKMNKNSEPNDSLPLNTSQ